MTMKPFRQLSRAAILFVLITIYSTITIAQNDPAIYIDDASVVTGETTTLDIKVLNFSEIISTSFTLNWDPMALRFVAIKDIALGLSLEDDFGVNNVDGGVITYLYFNNTLNGNTLGDESSLFAIELEAIGASNQTTDLTFSGSPTPIEIVDTSVQALPLTITGGTISITEMVNVLDINPLGFTAKDFYPNPFREEARMDFTLEHSGEIEWVLSTLDGKKVKSNKNYLSSGTHTLTFNKEDLVGAGQYLLSFHIGQEKLTRKLIFID